MTDPAVASLLTVAQAMEILDHQKVQPRVERVPLAEAIGLRIAADLRADRDYPPFRKSLMDGYAVRADEVQSAPVELSIVGEIAAGNLAYRPLGAGEAMAIMTGAPLPEGADAVVPVEQTEKVSGGAKVRLLAPATAGRFITERGGDCPAGREVLRRGMAIGPAQIAVAASVGAASLDVFAAPEIGVLGTGNELVDVETIPGSSQIRNSNTPMLMSMLRRLGCRVSDLGTVRDEPEAIRKALRRGLDHDALFVSGGMSMGEYDFVPRLLTELGVDLRITRLRIKPGKPFVFGVREGAGDDGGSARPQNSKRCFVFGLPGNPVSAFICVLRLASRLLTRMAGGTVEERWLTGRLDMGVPANGPREFYQPAVRSAPPGGKSAQAGFARITPLRWKGSADLYTLALANVLIVRAENEPAMPIGTVVRVLEM